MQSTQFIYTMNQNVQVLLSNVATIADFSTAELDPSKTFLQLSKCTSETTTTECFDDRYVIDF